MKNRKYLWSVLPLFIVLLLLSSCRKGEFHDDLSNDFDDTEETTDGENNPESGAGSDGETFLTLYRISGDNIDKIKDYNVSKRYKPLQEDYTKHLEMWNYFTRLIPVDNRVNITEFLIFEGGQQLAGFVEPIQDNLNTWRMGLAIDIAEDLENIDLQEEFAAVTIHEFGHVLTLNTAQIDGDGSEGSCSRFYTGEGCARSNSYINGLFNIGWADIYDEFLGIEGEKLYTRFYPKYQDRFVSEYAATNPGEDIAEVFTYFVVEEGPRSGNSIAAQKLNALYEYPELVDLRQQIRQNPAVRALNIQQMRRKPCRHQKGHRMDIGMRTTQR